MEVQNKANTKSMVTDLTQGNVARLLFAFAMPLFISNSLQAIYNIVDMVVVGQVIGGAGMSAVNIGGNILSILTFIAMGFSSAGQVIIARDVGRNDRQAVQKTIGTMFSFLLSVSLLVSVICFFNSHHLLRFVNTPAESYDYTMDYTLICIVGLFFIYGYNIVSAIMRGMGDSKRPFMFVAIAAAMNTVLDILFVAVLDMKVMGAALATVIGQAFSFIFALVYLYRRRESFGFDFRPESFLPNGATLKKLFALGAPMALQSASISISMTFVAAWVNSFGVVYSAIAGIVSKLNMMINVMSQALTTSAASMVGQNLGAKKYKRIPRILICVIVSSMAISLVCVVLLVLFPESIFRLFTSDAAVLALASIILLPSSLNFIGAATRSFAFAIINGSGDARLNLAIAILDGMIARICLAYLLGFTLHMGPQGFWLGDALAGFVPLLIGCWFYFSGRWKS